jgi:hypothetical protein
LQISPWAADWKRALIFLRILLKNQLASKGAKSGLVGLRERSARMGANVFFTGDPQTMRDVGAALDFELFAARVRGDGCRRRTGVVDARPHPPLVQFLRLAPHQQDIIISTIIVVIMIIIKERSSQLRSREQPPF